jgi:hypothetical protein
MSNSSDDDFGPLEYEELQEHPSGPRFEPPKPGDKPKPVPEGAKPPSAWAKAVQLTRAADLFAPLPPTNWLCEALELAPGPPAIWAGFGFGGKTYAAQALALAIATGRDVWGAFRCRQGRVLHMDFEQGRILTSRRYQKLARGMGIGPDDVADRLEVAVLPLLNLALPSAEKLLLEGTTGCALCIVDSYRAACPTIDENSSTARLPLDAMTRVSERNDCMFLVLHHANKPSAEQRPGGARMSMRGSGALYDACASQHVFTGSKGKPTVVHHEKARLTGKPRADFELEIRDILDDRGAFDGVEVVCSQAPDPDSVRNAGLTAIKHRILAFLASNPGSTRESIKGRVTGNDGDKVLCLNELVDEGKVRETGEGGAKGKARKYWLDGQ